MILNIRSVYAKVPQQFSPCVFNAGMLLTTTSTHTHTFDRLWQSSSPTWLILGSKGRMCLSTSTPPGCHNYFLTEESSGEEVREAAVFLLAICILRFVYCCAIFVYFEDFPIKWLKHRQSFGLVAATLTQNWGEVFCQYLSIYCLIFIILLIFKVGVCR